MTDESMQQGDLMLEDSPVSGGLLPHDYGKRYGGLMWGLGFQL
jgi:hypothetical protein